MIDKNSQNRLLSWKKINAELNDQSRDYLAHYEVLERVDSTSNRARELCRELNRAPVVVLAEQQYSGRGRKGRHWVSPRAENIYLSLAAEFSCSLAQLSGLSIALGVELSRMLSNLGVSVGLKWPNDIKVNDRKLAGILVETQVRANKGVCIVMGVGLNYQMSHSDADLIDQFWTDLSRELGQEDLPDRNRVVARMINAMVAVCKELPEAGLGGWLHDWRAFDLCMGHQIEVIDRSERYQGQAKGVDETGALLVDMDGEIRSVHSSEVSIRVLD